MQKKILLVNDSASLRTVVVTALEGAGYEVREACNGQEALEVLENDKVDLIISDVNMPVMDGLTFIAEVKKLPEYKFAPIIMLTTETGKDKQEVAQDIGVRAWVIKPFKPETMLDAVMKMIGT
ncbi:MAG: response regulator [Gammaproteobacteria bacterium]|nr:response regulator [Gammaproteobacteria bacterium]